MKRFLGCLLIFASFLCALPASANDIRVGSATDKGAVRPANEDSMLVIGDAGVYLVADGMGGHAAGEVASAMAVGTVAECLHLPGMEALSQLLPTMRTSVVDAAFYLANRRIYEDSARNPARRGMGTTMVGAVVHGGAVDIINLGDSRAYRIRSGAIVQISHDHSLVQELIDRGDLRTPEEIARFPYKNIITRAMGTHPETETDIFSLKNIPGDIYLLCSDGLTNELTDSQILEIIEAGGRDLQKTSEELVRRAVAAGGRDNVTVVLVAP